MDLSHPERTLIGRLDLPILITLGQSDREWTSPQIARAVGATPSGTRQALYRLADSGLVRITLVGQVQGFRLNTEHVMAEGILALGQASQKLRRRIIDQVEQWTERPLSLTLFGSWGRGEAGPASDIDLLFIHDDFDGDRRRQEVWDDQLDTLGQAIGRWSGNDSDRLSFSLSEWVDIVDSGDPLADSIRHSRPALLYGRPITTLVPTTENRGRA